MSDQHNHWLETWTLFGYTPTRYSSAYKIIEDAKGEKDDDSADYIFGWYQYLDRGRFDRMIKGNEMRSMGYADAKSYYEGGALQTEKELMDRIQNYTEGEE